MEKVIIIVLLCTFLVVFIYIEPILMKHKVKNDNEYGSARFSTDNEIKKNFKKEKVSNIKEAGLNWTPKVGQFISSF